MSWLEMLRNIKNAGKIDKKRYLRNHPYKYPVIKEIKPNLGKKNKNVK